MKTEVYIMFSATKIPGGPTTILEPAGCGADVATVKEIPVLNRIGVDITLDDTDPRVAKVLALLEQHKTSYLLGRKDVFTEDELQNARLLHMGRDINVNVFAGPRAGTKYDMSDACSRCGTGARQISPLYIGADDLAMLRKHRAIGSYYCDILVDGGMAKKLKDDAVTGISFGEVRARQKNKKWGEVAREQVLINRVMPPLSGKSTLVNREEICTLCRRGGFTSNFEVPFRLAYHAHDLAHAHDMNLSWEWFGPFKFDGNLDDALFAAPQVLVTPKVMNIFREAGVKTFEWTPVFVDE